MKSEKELLESRLVNTYGNMYEELLAVVRANQHDFKNQINTLYSMHITADSLEELVERQQKYSQMLLEKNKYNEILTGCGNPILASYLYCKYMEIEKQGIAFTYNIRVKEAECGLAVHELIEILGILLSNAIEAVVTRKVGKVIELNIEETTDNIIIITSNGADKILATDVENMFERGYSTKGEGRGVGLAQLKKIVKQVRAELYVQCYEKEKFYMLEFKIIIPK